MSLEIDLTSLFPPRPKTLDLVFDDESMDAILYGEDSTGPTTASRFQGIYSELEAIMAMMKTDHSDEVLERAARLLEVEQSLPEEVLSILFRWVCLQVPDTVWPIVRDPKMDYGKLLFPLYKQARQRQQGQEETGVRLFRWLEHRGCFEEARAVIADLLEVAKKCQNPLSEAILTNNLGYEYLLERNFRTAHPYFEQAKTHFIRLGSSVEVVNSEANILICEFEGLGIAKAEALRPRINVVLDELRERHDWRQRKPLVLLARLEAHVERFAEAITHLEEAIIAARDIPTLHRRRDMLALRRLQRRKP